MLNKPAFVDPFETGEPQAFVDPFGGASVAKPSGGLVLQDLPNLPQLAVPTRSKITDALNWISDVVRTDPVLAGMNVAAEPMQAIRRIGDAVLPQESVPMFKSRIEADDNAREYRTTVNLAPAPTAAEVMRQPEPEPTDTAAGQAPQDEPRAYDKKIEMARHGLATTAIEQPPKPVEKPFTGIGEATRPLESEPTYEQITAPPRTMEEKRRRMESESADYAERYNALPPLLKFVHNFVLDSAAAPVANMLAHVLDGRESINFMDAARTARKTGQMERSGFVTDTMPGLLANTGIYSTGVPAYILLPAMSSVEILADKYNLGDAIATKENAKQLAKSAIIGAAFSLTPGLFQTVAGSAMTRIGKEIANIGAKTLEATAATTAIDIIDAVAADGEMPSREQVLSEFADTGLLLAVMHTIPFVKAGAAGYMETYFGKRGVSQPMATQLANLYVYGGREAGKDVRPDVKRMAALARQYNIPEAQTLATLSRMPGAERAALLTKLSEGMLADNLQSAGFSSQASDWIVSKARQYAGDPRQFYKAVMSKEGREKVTGWAQQVYDYIEALKRANSETGVARTGSTPAGQGLDTKLLPPHRDDGRAAGKQPRPGVPTTFTSENLTAARDYLFQQGVVAKDVAAMKPEKLLWLSNNADALRDYVTSQPKNQSRRGLDITAQPTRRDSPPASQAVQAAATTSAQEGAPEDAVTQGPQPGDAQQERQGIDVQLPRDRENRQRPAPERETRAEDSQRGGVLPRTRPEGEAQGVAPAGRDTLGTGLETVAQPPAQVKTPATARPAEPPPAPGPTAVDAKAAATPPALGATADQQEPAKPPQRSHEIARDQSALNRLQFNFEKKHGKLAAELLSDAVTDTKDYVDLVKAIMAGDKRVPRVPYTKADAERLADDWESNQAEEWDALQEQLQESDDFAQADIDRLEQLTDALSNDDKISMVRDVIKAGKITDAVLQDYGLQPSKPESTGKPAEAQTEKPAAVEPEAKPTPPGAERVLGNFYVKVREKKSGKVFFLDPSGKLTTRKVYAATVKDAERAQEIAAKITADNEDMESFVTDLNGKKIKPQDQEPPAEPPQATAPVKPPPAAPPGEPISKKPPAESAAQPVDSWAPGGDDFERLRDELQASTGEEYSDEAVQMHLDAAGGPPAEGAGQQQQAGVSIPPGEGGTDEDVASLGATGAGETGRPVRQPGGRPPEAQPPGVAGGAGVQGPTPGLPSGPATRDQGKTPVGGKPGDGSLPSRGTRGSRGSGEPTAEPAGGLPGAPGVSGAAGSPVESETPREAKAPANAGSYTITDLTLFEKGGDKTKFIDNIKAIRLMKAIVEEQRPATPEEQDVLAKYVGWGRSSYAQGLFADYGETAKKWEAEREELRSLLTDEEYESARASTINAHYTSPEMADPIWRMAIRLGFRGGKVDESAIGTAIFYSTMPVAIRNRSSLHGSEMDTLTANIAKLLHPGASIEIRPYQEVELPEDFFDFLVSNFPFADIRIRPDKYNKIGAVLHDYFFLKGIRTVRPGGLLIAITSTGTMDKQDTRVREVLAEYADLVAAIRLPAGAFLKNAGTDVVTDVVILKRRAAGAQPSGPAWLNLGTVKDPQGGEDIPINEYYVQHPDQVLGTVDRKSKLYGGGQPHVSMTKDFMERLEAAIARLPENIYESSRHKPPAPRELVDAGATLKDYGHEIRDGAVWQREAGEMVKKDLPADKVKQVEKLLELRDALNELVSIELQDESDDAASEQRKVLNRVYDGYVKRYGVIHSRTASALLADDPDWPNLLSLENYNPETKAASKADVFTKRTIRAMIRPTKAESVEQAVGFSMNETASLDSHRIGELLGISPEDAEQRVVTAGIGFRLPGGGLEIKEYYLSGNVKGKLLEAKAAAKLDPDFNKNVQALEAVIPADVPHVEIDVKLGSPWVSAEDYKTFMADLMRARPDDFTVHWLQKSGRWVLELNQPYLKNRTEWNETYGTPDVGFLDIVESAMTDRPIVLHRTVGDPPQKVYMADESAAANLKVEEVREAFKEWIWRDDERRRRLTRYYNDNFNNLVETKHDGSWISFASMSPLITPRQHQRDAVALILHGRRALLGHEVGTGKTLIFAMAAAKAKELGFANKPALIVPKATIEQAMDQIKQAFPTMKVLTTVGNFDAKNRRKTIARIATGDWDMVLMTHDNYDMLDVDPEVQAQFLRDEIKELEDVIRQSGGDDDEAEYGWRRRRSKKKDKRTKQLEKMKQRLEEKLAEALKQPRDPTTTFQRTGIDMVILDEAHNYKSLPVYTARGSVKGIPQSRSARATNMMMNIQWLRKANPKAIVVFGTGTPLDNAMTEIYNWQRYLQPEELESRGIQSFDGWANTFGQTVTQVEPTAAGEFKPTSRFKRFTNLKELSAISRQILHTMFVEDIPGMVRPHKTETIDAAPLSDQQAAFMQRLAQRAKNLKGKKVVKGGDNMLKICTDGRKAALVNPDGTIPHDGKISRCIGNVLAYHKKDPGLTQMIFSDLGVGDIFGVNVYRHVIQELVKGGIPREKIIDFSKLDDGDERLLAISRLRMGDALVGIGSTAKLGTGVNAQNKLRWLHQLDAPMTPGRMEQRIGRGWRQGNENKDIGVIQYVTEGSLDAFIWSLINNKYTFNRQFLKYGTALREIEEVDSEELSPARVMAEATGNPDVLNAIEEQEAVKRLEQKQRIFERQRGRAVADLDNAKERLDSYQAMADGEDADAKAAQPLIESRTYVVGRQSFDEAGEKLEKAVDRRLDEILKLKAGTDRAEVLAIGPFTVYAQLVAAERYESTEVRIFGYYMAGPSGNKYQVLRSRDETEETAAAGLSVVRSASGVIRSLKLQAQSTRTDIAEIQGNIEKLEKLSGNVFTQADELQQHKRKYAELIARLQKQGKGGADETDIKISQAEDRLEALEGPARVNMLKDLSDKSSWEPLTYLTRLESEIKAIEAKRAATDELSDDADGEAPVQPKAMSMAPGDTAFDVAVRTMPAAIQMSFDPLQHKTVDDLIYLAEHEIDLYREGEETDIRSERQAQALDNWAKRIAVGPKQMSMAPGDTGAIVNAPKANGPNNYKKYERLVPISYLKSIAVNVRGETAESRQRIAVLSKSIASNGWTDYGLPISYHPGTKTVWIDEGNHRILAAEKAGYTHVPARVTRVSRKAEGRAAASARAVTGIEPDRFGYVPGDMSPEDVGVPFVRRSGPSFMSQAPGEVPLTGSAGRAVRVLRGDSPVVMKRLADAGQTVAMAVIDPPYFSRALVGGNRGIKQWAFVEPKDLQRMATELARMVRDDGHVYLMLSGAPTAQADMGRYVDAMEQAGFNVVQQGGFTKLTQAGSRATNMRGDQMAPERLILMTKSGRARKGLPAPNLDLAFTRVTGGYQTEKPVDLLAALVEQGSKTGETILDPYAGSGVTGDAAMQSGRKAILVDKAMGAIRHMQNRLGGQLDFKAMAAEPGEVTDLADRFGTLVEAYEYAIDDRGHGDDFLAAAAQQAWDEMIGAGKTTDDIQQELNKDRAAIREFMFRAMAKAEQAEAAEQDDALLTKTDEPTTIKAGQDEKTTGAAVEAQERRGGVRRDRNFIEREVAAAGFELGQGTGNNAWLQVRPDHALEVTPGFQEAVRLFALHGITALPVAGLPVLGLIYNNKVLIRASDRIGPMDIAWHELGHWLRGMGFRPFMKLMGLLDTATEAFRAFHGKLNHMAVQTGQGVYTVAEAREEAAADALMQYDSFAAMNGVDVPYSALFGSNRDQAAGLVKEIRTAHEVVTAALGQQAAEAMPGVKPKFMADPSGMTPDQQELFNATKAKQAKKSKLTWAPKAEGPVISAPPTANTDPWDYVSGIRDSITEARYAEQGKAAPLRGERRKWKSVLLPAAKRILDADPKYAQRLTESLEKNPRIITDTENAVLAYESVRLKIEVLKARESQNVERERQAQLEYNAAMSAWTVAGTKLGQALAARAILLKDDYSYANQIRLAEASKGRPLTDAETADIKTQTDQIAALETRIEKISKLLADEQASRAQLEAEAAKLKTVVADLESRGAALPETAVNLRRRKPKQADDEVIPSADDDASIKRFIIQRVAEYVKSGVRDHEAIMQGVTEDLQAYDIELSRKEVGQVFSDYGKIRMPSQDPVNVKLRELRRLEQLVQAIMDAESGKTPLKSGAQRDKPTQEIRERIRELRAAMKANNIETVSPEQQLATSIEASKRALQNRIDDLEKAIKTKTPIQSGGKAPVESPEITELRKQRDELRVEYDKLFPKQPLSDQRRLELAIQAAERRLADWETRLEQARAGVFKTAKAKPGLPQSAELDTLTKEIEAAKDEIEALKSAANPKLSPEQRELLAFKRRVAKEIQKASAAIAIGEATGDYSRPPKKPSLEARKLLDAEATTAYRELVRLRRRLTNARMAPLDRFLHYLVEFGRVIRSMKAGADVSYIRRQARILFTRDIGSLDLVARGKRKLATPEIVKGGLLAYFSEDFFADEMQENQRAHTEAVEFLTKWGLYTELDENTPIAKRIETGLSSAIEKAPGFIGWMYRAGNRSATVVTNKAGILLYEQIKPGYEAAGEFKTEADQRRMAKLIGDYIGRAVLPRAVAFRHLIRTISDFAFSARYAIARGRSVVTAYGLLSKSKAQRKEGFRTVFGTAIAMAVMQAIVAAINALFSDDEDEITTDYNPISTDFMKVKIGNTRFDMMSGEAQWLRFCARMATGMTTDAETGLIEKTDRKRVFMQFLQSKQAPLLSLINALAFQQGYAGKPLKTAGDWADAVSPAPLWLQDGIEVFADQYEKNRDLWQALVPGLAAMGAAWTGESLQTYSQGKPRKQALIDKARTVLRTKMKMEGHKAYYAGTPLPGKEAKAAEIFDAWESAGYTKRELINAIQQK